LISAFLWIGSNVIRRFFSAFTRAKIWSMNELKRVSRNSKPEFHLAIEAAWIQASQADIATSGAEDLDKFCDHFGESLEIPVGHLRGY
jgi:hypothetical protein